MMTPGQKKSKREQGEEVRDALEAFVPEGAGKILIAALKDIPVSSLPLILHLSWLRLNTYFRTASVAGKNRVLCRYLSEEGAGGSTLLYRLTQNKTPWLLETTRFRYPW